MATWGEHRNYECWSTYMCRHYMSYGTKCRYAWLYQVTAQFQTSHKIIWYPCLYRDFFENIMTNHDALYLYIPHRYKNHKNPVTLMQKRAQRASVEKKKCKYLAIGKMLVFPLWKRKNWSCSAYNLFSDTANAETSHLWINHTVKS